MLANLIFEDAYLFLRNRGVLFVEKPCAEMLWHLQKTMQIQFLFRVGALDVAAILHNEIIVRVPRGSGRLTYNVASLCNIAWGWFWAFERWETAYCFFLLNQKNNIKI